MIKDVDGRFDEYPIFLMIRHVLLHWGFELVENDLKYFYFWFILKLTIIGQIEIKC